MGATPVRSPGWPPRPNELLKYEPSTVMLFSRLSCPAKFEPLACGVRRVMSPIRPEMVGSVASSSLVTAVAAPVRFELNTGSLTPTTTMSSAMAATFSVKSRSCATPRLRETFSFTSVLNPLTDALTRYGPPTRIPGMKNRPSPCVMVSYLVPEGSWMAVTAAPGITAPCASLTRPVIEAVVTPCAYGGLTEATDTANPSVAAPRQRSETMFNRRFISVPPVDGGCAPRPIHGVGPYEIQQPPAPTRST